MVKSLALFSLFIAVSAANAQAPQPQDQQDPQAAAPQQSAPIVRSYPSTHSAFRQPRPARQIVESQPVPGVWLRSESQPGNQAATQTISATPQHAEFRLDHGRLNVTVHHPADHEEVLIDLPGGQISLFKDGLYTLNADTNTVRVLHGEAAAYPGPIAATPTTKPIKIKEDHQLSLVTAAPGAKPAELKSVEAYPYELTADLLPPSNEDRGQADYGEGYPPYGRSYYAGAWGYPYYGYYGYGYPFAYGIGFGYYGSFGGDYRGGFRR